MSEPARHDMNRHALKAPRQAGFTLIELMVTAAIVAIIAAIALPSYTNQIRKSRRGDAKSALLDMAAREERYNTVNFAYTDQVATLGYVAATSTTFLVPNVTTPYYVVSVTVLGTPPTSYTLTATPQGDQAYDGCKGFTLTDQGAQGQAGSPTTSLADCWK